METISCATEISQDQSQTFPQTQVYFDDSESESEGSRMEFRLTYQGPLHTDIPKEKHILRKEFHKQLKELWKQDPSLRYQSEARFIVNTIRNTRQIIPITGDPSLNPQAKTWVDYVADEHQRLGGRFVPLVSKFGGFTCSLDILFLRRDQPGAIIKKQGGDIDRRLIVLFDALRMPDTVGELFGFPLDSDEDPFYCLLEDDALITRVSVTTDRLLIPQTEDSSSHVHLVVLVTVINPGIIFAGGRLV